MISASMGSSTIHSRNLSILTFGCSSSQWCPLTRRMSFSNNRAPTLKRATRPMGSNTLNTRLSTKRCVKIFFSLLEIPRITTSVSVLRSHFTTSTCENSSLNDAITFGSANCCDPSISLARFDKLLTNSVSLNSPKCRRWTSCFDLLRALNNCPCRRFLGRLWLLPGTDQSCLGRCVGVHI